MIDEPKMPLCKRCHIPHYNFEPCKPRQDKKPPGWANTLGNNMIGLFHNGGNTFLHRREGER